ncbi:uncharacterized protein B0I36DRAFT_416923 [Microdochium trichocladiopsis]|uniref:Uncharacterized protein n=1 Tax=Microdochium trichocladiopsis TaxID=1682393 RepID=A0A9P9BPX7_9PEZI|nr:uncharacterized protein B0I36DRAFT_416923 [Microdochium trichocladiopsis]KAH7024986.1 hypothetical protein B0I36DRAFT_416923 [Microdochium trichocladiopsis]
MARDRRDDQASEICITGVVIIPGKCDAAWENRNLCRREDPSSGWAATATDGDDKSTSGSTETAALRLVFLLPLAAPALAPTMLTRIASSEILSRPVVLTDGSSRSKPSVVDRETLDVIVVEQTFPSSSWLRAGPVSSSTDAVAEAPTALLKPMLPISHGFTPNEQSVLSLVHRTTQLPRALTLRV